jgi:hypothetical protein
MNSKKKGGCKLVALIVLALIVVGVSVYAAEPAINPAQVTAGRVVLYGTTPLKIGSTEFTEALLSASVGTIAVAKGGTGATTLTGLVKGNGTSAMTAATAGTDYLAPATGASVTNATLALQGINGSTNTLTIVKGVITAIVTTGP